MPDTLDDDNFWSAITAIEVVTEPLNYVVEGETYSAIVAVGYSGSVVVLNADEKVVNFFNEETKGDKYLLEDYSPPDETTPGIYRAVLVLKVEPQVDWESGYTEYYRWIEVASLTLIAEID